MNVTFISITFFEEQNLFQRHFSGSLELCTTVVVRSAVTGPDSSRV